ncbi:MAG TPA: hypothetical protein VKS24_25130 [Bradyrhizobium sp.]|nr:hypothetical protein [Bradyrhizobium sp.]
MPPYLKLTRTDGRAIHVPTPFAFSEDAGGTLLHIAWMPFVVSETPEQICSMLGITRPTVGEHDKLRTAARRVVDARYRLPRTGIEWHDLSSAIAALADIVGGGTLEDQGKS